MFCAALAACASDPSPEQSNPQTKTEVNAQTATQDAILNPKTAPSVDQMTDNKELEQRKAQFEARSEVSLPDSLPKGLKALPKKLQAKVTRVVDENRARVGKGDPWREILMEIRLFGEDDAVDAALLDGLKDLAWPGFSGALPEAPVKEGEVTWDLQRFRLKAKTPGARETRAVLTFKREPQTPKNARKCKKPISLEFKIAPEWLQKATAQTSTRRRVAVREEISAEERKISCLLFFQIGESHDEGVGRLMQAARDAGLSKVSGEGPRQLWKGPSGTLRLEPSKGDLGLGCSIQGPVLQVEWIP